MIIFQHRIYRIDLRANPEVLYVFGDNVDRVGLGGQAGEMRGEPNAVGVATKWSPSMRDTSFFDDSDYEHISKIIDTDFEPLFKAALNWKTIILPADGLGTGLSEMPTRCPKLYQLVRSYVETLKSY